jgi:hypothetical protein
VLDEVWLDRPEQWDELAGLLRRAGELGLDTEFHGVELDQQSPVGRGVVHVWSVAVRTGELDPRGYHRCRGWVLPAAALVHPRLVAVLEDVTIVKAVHNQSVDHHTLRNHGVQLRGAVNTLGLIRWCRPGLITQPGRFGLKALMVSLLGRAPVCSFRELVSYERMETYSTWKTVTRKTCSCGAAGCRKRSPPNLHEKGVEAESVEIVRERKVRGQYPLTDIVPGHERWELLLRYALEDAVAALQVLELAEDTPDPAPWPFGGTRPGFNQAVEEAVIEMESVGFHVDVEWCRQTAIRAENDEQAALAWLYRWWVVNSPGYGPHRPDDVDSVWSSGPKKLALFDALGFPRSPIWKKGRVKPGDVKLDGAAMEWIAGECPESAQLIKKLLHLQRIRSGKKYLVKLRDSGGVVHPICGPAGDEDDRAGAVTGRLGIKGELEAQQLPKEGDKDLYEIRRAIVA